MSAEHEAARIRDIPRSCTCPWTYDHRAHRWVWDGYREHCPWHGGREGRAA